MRFQRFFRRVGAKSKRFDLNEFSAGIKKLIYVLNMKTAYKFIDL
jgi:hypothetical protein